MTAERAGDTGLRITFSIAEATPFVKVGGLADVGGGLPRALARRGHDVRLVLPGYPAMSHGELVATLEVPMGTAVSKARIWRLAELDGVEVLTVSDGVRFRRTYGYGDDEIQPFVLFSKALVRFAALDPPDVVHLNDWHCGLAAQYARKGPERARLTDTATLFTIHNDRYEGRVTETTAPFLEPDTASGTSMLRRGIRYADAVSTVSNSYRDELLRSTRPDSCTAELLARDDEPHAILNGIDYDDFDPSRDRHLPTLYDASAPQGKAIDKFVLQREARLRTDPAVPVLGMVARLARQKGMDLVRGVASAAIAAGAQIVVMGRGDLDEQQALRAMRERHPGSFAYMDETTERWARLVYAGSDMFLAPSRYEPCGLGPLIALRYGAVPIASRVGGMAETIVDHRDDPATGTGFLFDGPTERGLAGAIARALEAFRDRSRWDALRRRAMDARFTWDEASIRYEQLYRDAQRRRQPRESG